MSTVKISVDVKDIFNKYCKTLMFEVEGDT